MNEDVTSKVVDTKYYLSITKNADSITKVIIIEPDHHRPPSSKAEELETVELEGMTQQYVNIIQESSG